MFEIVDDSNHENAVIKVIGVGGGGGNAVRHMVESEIEGVEFIGANTDAQALAQMGAGNTIQIGANVTKGLGAGADPEVGRHSAMEDRDQISKALEGTDLLFITAGMGGGTGTGAAPVVAEVAQEMGILTVAVVTKPFGFEGKKRIQVADSGLKELQGKVDSLITIPNERLLSVMGRKMSLLQAFAEANNVLLGAVQGISDLITRSGIINVDFADVKTVMSVMGTAMMGTGSAKGDNRAEEAAHMAINSPLLDNVSLEGAKGILVNITANNELGLGEFSEVGDIIRELASESATVVVGTVIDDDMDDELKVTVVATGLDNPGITDVAKKIEDPEKQKEPEDASNGTNNGPINDQAKGLENEIPNYRDLDHPTIARRKRQQEGPKPEGPDTMPSQADVEFLDIPAFLRRSAK